MGCVSLGRGDGFSKCHVFLFIFTVHNLSNSLCISQITENKSYTWEGWGMREVPMTICHNRSPQFQLTCGPFPPEFNFFDLNSLLYLDITRYGRSILTSARHNRGPPVPVRDRDVWSAPQQHLPAFTGKPAPSDRRWIFLLAEIDSLGQYLSFFSKDNHLQFSILFP